METEVQDGTSAAEEHGRAMVRQWLIAPLETAGLRRGHGVTQDAHAARLARIERALCHMSAENLATLAEVTATNAQGGYKDCWPPEIAVINWGRALQPPPPREARILRSWLASVEGPRAMAGGWHVELYRYLRRRGVPPAGIDVTRIREEGANNARLLAVYQERQQRGTDGPEERLWMADYLRDRAEAEDIIATGVAKREGTAA